MTSDNDALVRAFVQAFSSRDAALLSPFLHGDVVFRNYGEDEVHGRTRLLEVWAEVFRNFAQVEFKTVHQAVNGDVVIAEQIHGLALPGGSLVPVMNMAVYEIRDGLIAAWRDYTNPGYAGRLLRG